MIESAGAVAGTYLPVQCPVKRCLPLQGGFALDIDPGLGREPLLFQPRAAGLNQALVKGRVKKDQREASLVRRTGGKESLGIGHLDPGPWCGADRKSTRLNSSHVSTSYAVFCLKKKKTLTSHSNTSP